MIRERLMPPRFASPPAVFVALWLLLLVSPGCTEIKRWAYEGGDRNAWQQQVAHEHKRMAT